MVEELTMSEVWNLFRDKLRDDEGRLPQTHIFISDNSVKTVDAAKLRQIKAVLFILRLIPYSEQRRDCDDFAKLAVGIIRLFFPTYAFGEIWADGIGSSGGRHAMNFFITDEKKIVLYEPQNGKTKKEFSVSGQNSVLWGL